MSPSLGFILLLHPGQKARGTLFAWAEEQARLMVTPVQQGETPFLLILSRKHWSSGNKTCVTHWKCLYLLIALNPPRLETWGGHMATIKHRATRVSWSLVPHGLTLSFLTWGLKLVEALGCDRTSKEVTVVPHLGEVSKGAHGTGFREHIYLSGAHAIYVKPELLWILKSNANGHE